MKQLVCIFSILFSLSTLAGISLDIDFKNNVSGKTIHFKKTVETYLDETNTFKIPNTNNILEIKVTDRIPEIFLEGVKGENQVFIDMKLIEVVNNKRKVIASPKVISTLGKEASMKTYEDDAMKKEVLSLVIIPKKM